MTQEKAAEYLAKALAFLSNVAAKWILQLLLYCIFTSLTSVDKDQRPYMVATLPGPVADA